MPGFSLTGRARAPAEDVWKLLFDPTRFPEWWDGVETVHADGPGTYTQWLAGYPDFPMPQVLRSDQTEGRVTISCQVSDVDVAWRLAAAGAETSIEVRVDVTEAEAHRLDQLHTMIATSLSSLAALAESESPIPPDDARVLPGRGGGAPTPGTG